MMLAMGPLGDFSQPVAAFVAVCSIGAAIVSRPLGFQDPWLDVVAGVALGAIFGSTATANGVKAGQVATIGRLEAAAVIATARDTATVERDAAATARSEH